MIDKRKARQLFGETVREIGILLAVFAPLDAMFQRESPETIVLSEIILLALLSMAIGIMIEAAD